jgi:hypothetical protein
MINFFTVFLGFLILFFSFFEVIVFNEEVFLSVCFLNFLFIGYYHFNTFFSSAFTNRSKIFSLSLLSSFILYFDVLYQSYSDNLFSNYTHQVNSYSRFLHTKFYEQYIFFWYFCESLFETPYHLFALCFSTETKIFFYAQVVRSQAILFFLSKLTFTNLVLDFITPLFLNKTQSLVYNII